MEVKRTVRQKGAGFRDEIWDFGADLKDCRYYIHEQKLIKKQWKSVKKYWK